MIKRFKSTAFSSVLVISLYVITTAHFSYADSISEATVAPPGIQIEKESNISLDSELVHIRRDRIEITDILRNDSQREITTEVSFPVRDYRYRPDGIIPDFRDFEVEINGRKIEFKTDVEAIVKGKNYAKLLERMGVSITDFGKFNPSSEEKYFEKLSIDDQKYLIKQGLMETYPKMGWPAWTVSIKYHWTQTIPADGTVYIKYSYKPVSAKRPFAFIERWDSPRDLKDIVNEDRSFLIRDSCIDKETQARLERYVMPNESYINATWVSYVLTSPRQWRRSITSFNLAVEVEPDEIMGVCFDHEFSQTSPSTYETVVENYHPRKDLKVYFFRKN